MLSLHPEAADGSVSEHVGAPGDPVPVPVLGVGPAQYVRLGDVVHQAEAVDRRRYQFRESIGR